MATTEPAGSQKPRIAHFEGPAATIQNSPPLVTSNKAREKYGLPPLANPDGSRPRFDVLRPQRLARPAVVYVEAFSAHPLERDVAELYAPPDGYLDSSGEFHREQRGPDDVPVYEVTLLPEDGVYPLPYMARQADGTAWEGECAYPFAPAHLARQTFYPDGSRTFEEIDRLGIGGEGKGNLISSKVDVDFYRAVPTGGYTKGLPAAQRTDVGEGDIPPEARGRDFFAYRPYHLAELPPMPALARAANVVQRALATGRYAGAIWTQGSPQNEETTYWFNLLIDTTVPIVGSSAQRTHQHISNDGNKNIVDAVDYILSRVWADAEGRNRAGVVMIQEEQVFYSRDVQKADARPGNYVATGGHGGIIGSIGHTNEPRLTFVPVRRHTYQSAVNVSRLPREVPGVRAASGRLEVVSVPIKDPQGDLLESAIPKVTIVKDGSYTDDTYTSTVEGSVDIAAQIEKNLRDAPLAGFVVEGLAPYGVMTSTVRARAMRRAVHRGMPVVCVGRGNAEGFASPSDRVVGGNNLTATKARLLLMACLMRFGALPPAANPDSPTDAELQAIREKLALYQEVFDTH